MIKVRILMIGHSPVVQICRHMERLLPLTMVRSDASDLEPECMPHSGGSDVSRVQEAYAGNLPLAQMENCICTKQQRMNAKNLTTDHIRGARVLWELSEEG
jgi:hypothetical protein